MVSSTIREPALRGKVAGNRKLTEILKIAIRAETTTVLLVLAFSRRFRTGLGGGAGAREEEVGEQSVLAPALFGGVPATPTKKGKKGGKKKKKGGAHMGGQGSGDGAAKIEEASDRVCTLPPVVRFNSSMFERLCASLQPHVDNVSPDESLGCILGSTIVCGLYSRRVA